MLCQLQLTDVLLRQAMMDNIGVLVATVIMVIMALTTLGLKVTFHKCLLNRLTIEDVKHVQCFLKHFIYSRGFHFTSNAEAGVAIINGGNSHNKCEVRESKLLFRWPCSGRRSTSPSLPCSRKWTARWGSQVTGSSRVKGKMRTFSWPLHLYIFIIAELSLLRVSVIFLFIKPDYKGLIDSRCLYVFVSLP